MGRINTFKTPGIKSLKCAVTVVAALLLAVIYLLIFEFSAQDSKKSSDLSYKVSKHVVETVDTVAKMNWTDAVKEKLAVKFNHPIRKLAHFSEYTCMGILVFTMLRPWRKRDFKCCLFITAWVFISASLDEFHQTFVSGRDGNFFDVLLDTCGGIFGIIIFVCAEVIFLKIYKKFKKSKAIKNKSKNKQL